MLLVLSWSAPGLAKERTRWFELQPQLGFAYVNLTGFSKDKFLDEAQEEAELSLEDAQIPVRGTGPSVGLGAQLKAWVFVLGARYNYSHTSDFGLHTVGGDLGLRLGDQVALYGRAGGGLAFASSLPAGLDTDGFVISGSGGLDIALSPELSLGFGADIDVLLMTQAQTLQDAASRDLDVRQLDRNTIGFQLRPQVHLTWHL